jgi:hypothetical protein
MAARWARRFALPASLRTIALSIWIRGAEALRLVKANAKAADARKSPKLYMKLCKYGHSLDNGRIYFRYGYECRRCLKGDPLRNARAGVIKPEALAQATVALRNGATVTAPSYDRPVASYQHWGVLPL